MIRGALSAIGNSIFWTMFITSMIVLIMGLKDLYEIMLCLSAFGIALNISSLFIKFDIEAADFEENETK